MRVIALVHGVHSLTALMVWAFHDAWDVRFVSSTAGAMDRLLKGEGNVLIYDWDAHPNAWFDFCTICTRGGIGFYLAATRPPDGFSFLWCAGAAAGFYGSR